MITQNTLKRLLTRQGGFRWGDTYVPGILAVPGEAPKISRPCRLNSRKLGRAMHLMSVPERVFTQLALFNPLVWDIHEQKILQVGPNVHPLFGHPLTVGMALPGVKGTLAVASRIGMTHARISANLDGEITRLPYNYVGDLLLYLQAQNGQPYAINWTIKISGSDFHEKRRSEIKGLAHQKSDREKARLRHLLEREYYADAGIRTLALSLDDIPDMVVANLDLLYGYHDLPIDIDASLLNDYSAELLEKSVQGIPPALVAIEYAKRWGHRDLLLARIYQEIWCRKLLVNLNKPILVDKPLWIGGPDLLDAYVHLFEEHSA
ncbi:hypothetical protein ALQ08_200170 [Pseudomonas syringae pv. delphinii]|nr:hypothetical protein ALO72_200226 [Pseudomonas syringae pv. delphinii]RMQ28589.1 hypothetical protein ALQ08_200170 [Pseudomonas syringae pv. delphinii]